MVDDAGDPEVSDEQLGGPEQPNPERALNPADERVTGRRLGAMAALLGGGVVIAAVIYAYIGRYPGPERDVPEAVLLIAGFVTVTLLLYLGTIILRALDLGAPAEALGMPPGSIRALIAMSLILIFAIAGFVVFKSGSGTSHESVGVTQAQIDQLRQDGARITQLTLVTAQGQPALYNVVSVQPLSDDAHDFGLQLLSIVSTLVVAVAGFYFGAQTVNQAGREVRAQLGMIQQGRKEAIAAGVIGAKPDPALAALASGSVNDEPPVVEVDSIGGEGDDGGGGDGGDGGSGDGTAGTGDGTAGTGDAGGTGTGTSSASDSGDAATGAGGSPTADASELADESGGGAAIEGDGISEDGSGATGEGATGEGATGEGATGDEAGKP